MKEHRYIRKTYKLNEIDLDKQKYIESLIERGDSEEQIKNKVNKVFGEEKKFSPEYDEGKRDYTLLPINELEQVLDVLEFGAIKYSPNAWQSVNNGLERYKKAMLRHMMSYLKGEKIDSESGLSHLSHLATNILFIMWFENSKEEK